MNKFLEKLEEKLMPIAAFMGQQRHLLAIRDGIVAALPFTMIGSVLLILGCPPYDPANPFGVAFIDGLFNAWTNWANASGDLLWPPYYATMQIMAVFVVIAMAYSLAKSYEKNAINYAISTLAIYFLIAAPNNDGVALSMANFGSKGLVIGMFVSLISVEIMRFVEDKGWTIKMPKGVPAAVSNSFKSLFPFGIALIAFFALSVACQKITGMIIPDAFNAIFQYIRIGVDNVFTVSILTFIENILFAFGVHPTTVCGPLLDTLEALNAQINAEMFAAGLEATKIYTNPFWAFYVAIGGGGSTLALTIICLRSKNKHVQQVGKLSLVPAIFNINEPIIFGLPIFLNPTLIIPFAIAPVINCVIAWTVTALGLVNVAVINAPWTAPAPFGAILSTLDLRAGVLCVLLIVLDAIIFYPFLKMYEKTLVESEEKE